MRVTRTAEADTAPPKAEPLKASSKLALPVTLKSCLYDNRVYSTTYTKPLTSRRSYSYSRLGSLTCQGRRAKEALRRYGYIDFLRSTGHIGTPTFYSKQAIKINSHPRILERASFTYQSSRRKIILAGQCRPNRQTARLALWRIVSPSQQLPTVRPSAPNLLRLIMAQQ